MKILGVGGLLHDASVALLDGEEILMAIESEKVTRQKHEINICPDGAINFILDANNTSLSDIDYIASNWRSGPTSNLLYIKLLKNFVTQRCFPWQLLAPYIVTWGSHFPDAFLRLQETEIPPIVEVRHHLSHLGSCYTVSDFDEAAVAIFDGFGELECTSLYTCQGRKITKHYSMDLPVHSLGNVYCMSTVHLGYRMLSDEYKVMGLAAYGEGNKKFRDFFCDFVKLLPEGRYAINRKYIGNFMKNGYRFPRVVHDLVGPPRSKNSEIEQQHKDFAFELQRRTEETMVHVLRHLRKVSGSKNLCMAGGLALNAVANGKIREQVDFENVFIQPAASDAGTSLGAAAYLQYHKFGGDRPGPMSNAYLGPGYSDSEIEAELIRVQCKYEKVADPATAAAELIAGQQVIGWFQGRAEYGPRALGARSILADPRHIDMKTRINSVVKEREGYRPFAPSILKESMPTYFETLTDAPSMTVVGKVKKERKSDIPAVVHVDGTARPQAVTEDQNPVYHRLIKNFEKLTGVPIVLNTSFNVGGEPIVLTPNHAIRCFYGSDLDALVIGSFMVKKRNA